MTVAELINQLDKCDKNKKVVFSEYVLKTVDGYNGYFPEPRDIAMIDVTQYENCVTLILDSVNMVREEDNLEVFNAIDNCVHTEEVIDITVRHLCPYCRENYYMVKNMSSTCVYYPPIYKDGVNINPDRNKTTVECTCMNCGKDFSYEE